MSKDKKNLNQETEAQAEAAEAEKAEAEETEAQADEKSEEAKAEESGEAKSEDAQADADAEASEEAKDSKDAKDSKEDEALNARYLRLMADFQNFKRRTEKEKSDIYQFANEKIVVDLLNVIDNFERALEHAEEGDNFSEGMKMVFKQLQGVLEKAGVKEIEALGQDFDPKFHNAVMTEDSDQYESGKVTAVFQKGYILNNKVIRPSMVKVAN